MKNLKSILLLTSLVSLIYIVSPSDALAQNGGMPPCCYNNMSLIYVALVDDGIRSLIVPTESGSYAASIHSSDSGDQPASLQTNKTELRESMQFGIESPKISFVETGIINRFLARDREIFYGKHT